MWVISIITSIVTLISSIGTRLISGDNNIIYESIETNLKDNGIENYRDFNEFISKRINEIMEEGSMPKVTYDFEIEQSRKSFYVFDGFPELKS